MKKTGTMLIIALLVLLAALLVVARARAEDGQPVYLPMVGRETGRGPYRVTGTLEKIYPIEAYSCQIIHLCEVYDYDPNTGTGIFACDWANDPGDITGDAEKEGEVAGEFLLNEVLDENGIPVDIPTSDWLFVVGMPDCGEGYCYDIVEWPIIKLYPGSVVDVGTIYAKDVRQYCWADPEDGGRMVFEFATVNGEMVITRQQ